jgi:hypothetical protein
MQVGQCKSSEMSPTREGRFSPAGEFFVVRASRSETPPLEATREAGSTLPQATPKQPATLVGKTYVTKTGRNSERRSPRSRSFPILNCEGHSPASGTAPVERPLSGRAESPNDAHCSLGKRASSARPFFPAEINICTLLTNCVLSFTSVSALRYSHTKLRIASWTWR